MKAVTPFIKALWNIRIFRMTDRKKDSLTVLQSDKHIDTYRQAYIDKETNSAKVKRNNRHKKTER